jgi:YggT family protein
MYALGSLILTLVQILSMILTVYTYVIIAAAIISWVNPDPYNPIVRFLRQITEPVFYQVRKILPRALFRTGIDFTPLIVLLLIFLIKNWGLRMVVFYTQRWIGPA